VLDKLANPLILAVSLLRQTVTKFLVCDVCYNILLYL